VSMSSKERLATNLAFAAWVRKNIHREQESYWAAHSGKQTLQEQTIAADLGVPRQSLAKWKNGNQVPDDLTVYIAMVSRWGANVIETLEKAGKVELLEKHERAAAALKLLSKNVL